MENAQRGKTFQIYSEIIPRMLEEDRVFGYVFDGYWQYSRTIDEYYRANMDLLAEPSPIDLAAWQVRTNPASVRTGDMPPVRFKKGSSAVSSIISGGSIVEGEVATSVLSPYVHVKKGARVVDSVLMHETVVEEGAEVVGCILDKGVIVGKDARIGVGDRAKPNAEVPHSLASGVTVIGKDTKIPARMKIGTNCLIYPDLEELGRSSVPDGTTIK
jgi:glucose-1-phosphate adenylyltransferase